MLSPHTGLVPPIVAQRLMGTPGELLMLLMIIMAVTSTGSAEIIAVTSILVYDIYQLYLKVLYKNNVMWPQRMLLNYLTRFNNNIQQDCQPKQRPYGKLTRKPLSCQESDNFSFIYNPPS